MDIDTSTRENSQFVSPRDHFIFVARDLESLASFLHANNGYVRQPYLIRRRKYFRHFRSELDSRGWLQARLTNDCCKARDNNPFLKFCLHFAPENVAHCFATKLRHTDTHMHIRCVTTRATYNWAAETCKKKIINEIYFNHASYYFDIVSTTLEILYKKKRINCIHRD